jgi:hypothetical protein
MTYERPQNIRNPKNTKTIKVEKVLEKPLPSSIRTNGAKINPSKTATARIMTMLMIRYKK